jgi:hypothetical protein
LPRLILDRKGPSKISEDSARRDQRAISAAVDEGQVAHVNHNGDVIAREASSTNEVALSDVEFA